MISNSSETIGVILPDTDHGLPSLLVMAPKKTPEKMAIEIRRASNHAVKEFSQIVSSMVEEGDTQEIPAAVEGLAMQMKKLAEEVAALNPRPPRPHWPTLIGSWIALAALIVPALLYCGALQNRVATLEGRASAFDRIASLDAKVDSLTTTMRELESRFNSWIDKAAEERK